MQHDTCLIAGVIKDRIKALAVEKCIEWCPNFNPEETKLLKLGDIIDIPERPKNPREEELLQHAEKRSTYSQIISESCNEKNKQGIWMSIEIENKFK